MNDALEYTKIRKQFGKPLVANQSVQFKLADMATNLTASRLMVRNAARMLDQNHPQAPAFCAMAKQFATDHCFNVCRRPFDIRMILAIDLQ